MKLEAIKGLTFSSIIQTGEERLEFKTTCGRVFDMFHLQDCCESVYLEDVSGDFSDLIGSPILVAEERTTEGEEGGYGTYTWTFYTFRTLKGSVDLRWYGSSNGYYSESVDFEERNPL